MASLGIREKQRREECAYVSGLPHLKTPRGFRYLITLKRLHSPGTPFSGRAPRSWNSMPDPTTRSLTVPETRTSPGPALSATRAPICTATPPKAWTIQARRIGPELQVPGDRQADGMP